MTDHSVGFPSSDTASTRLLQCGSRVLDLSIPQVMGVLNVTPDSFSDGGHLHSGGGVDLSKVLLRVEQMVSEGAAIVDVGGESTRPGAASVSLQQEMDRVLPVVEAIAERFDTIISVDTSSPQLMVAAAKEGAGLINDVRGLEKEGALLAAADTRLPVCLMHMQGRPSDMQTNPCYKDVVTEVVEYLERRVQKAIEAGVAPSAIIVDPGFGFGKTVEHNLRLLNQLPRIKSLGFPVLVGLSRKSLIGKVLGREVDQRLAGSLALAVMAVERGASIVRCHDVGETCDALRMLYCVQQEKFSG